jgi:MoaD family protein
MRVTVEFFGPARDAAGMSRLLIECAAPCSAHDVVTRMAHEHGGRLASLLLHDDRLASSVIIAVNDRQAGADEQLKDGDVVTVIPPISGGAA